MIILEIPYATRIYQVLATRPRTLVEVCWAYDRAGKDVLDHSHADYALHELLRLQLVECHKIKPPSRYENEHNDLARVVWMLARREGDSIPTWRQLFGGPFKAPALTKRRIRRHWMKKATGHEKKERAEPIEILARMAGRTTFRAPTVGGGIPVTPLDVAHAVAANDKHGNPMPPLGKAMAMAMACQREDEWPTVFEHARPQLISWLHNQRQNQTLCDAPHTYRARMVLHDAFMDLLHPLREIKFNERRKATKMKRHQYLYLLRAATALLEAAANTSAANAVRYLFALTIVEHPFIKNVRAVSYTAMRGIVLQQGVEVDPCAMLSIDAQLLAEVIARPRRAGVLSLARA